MKRELIPWWWKYGRPADFWIKNIEPVKVAINKYKLTPVPTESLMSEDIFTTFEGTSKQPPWIVRKTFPGGLRIPHFHFEKDVYLLNEEQWKDFSGNIIREFQNKLAKVNNVSFDQFLEISEAIESLP